MPSLQSWTKRVTPFFISAIIGKQCTETPQSVVIDPNTECGTSKLCACVFSYKGSAGETCPGKYSLPLPISD